MCGFYEKYYAAIPTSQSHAAFCERVYGRNLDQHGFADMGQIAALLDVLQLRPDQRVLDVGCGSGLISEHISDRTGVHMTGLDNVLLAIQQAKERTTTKAERLAFVVGDINALDLPDGVFDAIISIDSLFCEDDTRTIGQLARALRPGGQMAIFFSHGRHPSQPKESFRPETLAPGRTPIGEALTANGLVFHVQDFTAEDYRLIQRRKQILPSLRAQFEAEDCLFLYENRMDEANGISQAHEDNLYARYLYHVVLPA
jgi:ubiquinone/menaquinone biosynthesis C-methylase UbiE